MDRYIKSGGAASPPSTPASASVLYPSPGDTLTATPASKPGAWWYHMITESIRRALVAAGLTPAYDNLDLLTQAIQALGNTLSVQGAFKNLRASASGTSANVLVSADELVLESPSNFYHVARSVSLTIAGTSTGANGLDTGSLAADTWYSVWAIYNGTTVAGLLSLSETAPTLPGGYTYKARVGYMRTDSSGNKYPLAFKQYGRRVQQVVAAGTNVTALRTLASGTSGTPGTTLTSVAVANFVPVTAFKIAVNLYTENSGSGNAQVSPNSVATVAGGPSLYQNITSTTGGIFPYEFILESANIYYAASNATIRLYLLGWEDNI